MSKQIGDGHDRKELGPHISWLAQFTPQSVCLLLDAGSWLLWDSGART